MTRPALGVDLSKRVDQPFVDDEDRTARAILEVSGGVLATEVSGYGDPTVSALRALSEDGGTSAVVRDNIQAHLRFGCARDGDLLFDDDQFTWIEDPDVVPAELRPLFDLAWDDPGEDSGDDDGPDGIRPGGGRLSMKSREERMEGVRWTVQYEFSSATWRGDANQAAHRWRQVRALRWCYTVRLQASIASASGVKA